MVVGVDVGGTFTDLFILDESTGQASIVKVPSTRGNESQGFMNALGKISAQSTQSTQSTNPIEMIKTIVHGCAQNKTAVSGNRVG